MSQRAKMRGEIRDERRCTATARRTGERCRAPAILGGAVCRVHGGAAKQTKRKARERLLELVDPAIAALDKVLRDPDKDDNVKVRAALGILDRTGFRPGVVLEVAPSDEWSALLNGALSEEDDRSLPGAPVHPELESGHRAQLAFEEAERLKHERQDRDDEERRSTKLDNRGHDVVQPATYGRGPFASDNRPPADPRSVYDPSPVGLGAPSREQILRERLGAEDDPEPRTWTSRRRR